MGGVDPQGARLLGRSRVGPAWLGTGALVAALTVGLPAAAQAAPSDSRSTALAASTAFQTAAKVPVGWTGSVDSCAAGTESAASLQATLDAVNLLRAAAAVPSVTFDSALNQKALAAALIMAGQQDLSHYPGSSWKCYTAVGAEAAGRSNLAIGFDSGPAAMLGYAHDDDVNTLGHRRWLLDPAATVFGSGSTGPLSSGGMAANALWVINGGSAAAVPAGKQVAWPPAGHVPLEWLPEVWSLAIGAPGQTVDASAARVQMSLDGTALAEPGAATRDPGYGTGTTIAWSPYYDSALLDGAQHTFVVSISGITVGGAATPVQYSVIVDNAAPGAPSAVSAALDVGGAAADVSWTAPAVNGGTVPTSYTVTASPGGATCFTSIWGVDWENQPIRRSAAPTRCRIGGLAGGVDHTFTVTARNEAGIGPASAASNVVRPITAPQAPVNVSTTIGPGPLPGIHKVWVSWTPPANDGGSPITGYRVVLSDGQAQVVSTPSAAFGRLDSATTYSVGVQALNAKGASPASGVDFTTPSDAQADFDGDGVPDDVDQCPALAGASPSGCTTSTPIPTQTPPPGTEPQPTTSTLPAAYVKVKAASKRSKLAVDVNPNKGKGYWSFQVQRSDNGNWTPLKTYRTSGAKEKRTVNLPKGTYRVVVLAKYGHRETTSGSVVLLK